MQDRTCDHCGERYTPHPRARHRRWCSSGCAAAHLRASRGESEAADHLEAERTRDARRRRQAGIPTRRWASAAKRQTRAASGTSGGRTVLAMGTCPRCGDQFTKRCAEGTTARYCTKQCRWAANKRGGARRAQRLRNQAVAPVDRRIIFERDNWTCGICTEAVDPACKYPDPWSASLDHIVPLAANGTHEPDNVQCSHLMCNLRKGARTSAA